jgi:hypothetical protein
MNRWRPAMGVAGGRTFSPEVESLFLGLLVALAYRGGDQHGIAPHDR